MTTLLTVLRWLSVIGGALIVALLGAWLWSLVRAWGQD